MRHRIRLLSAILAIVALLGITAATAVALRSLSLEGEGGRTTLTLNSVITFEGGGTRITCPITLIVTLSRAFPKIEGTLIGRVTGFLIGRPNEERCRSSVGTLNAIRILGLAAENLWRLFYKTFLGSLPNPSGYLIQLKNMQVEFEMTALGTARCLYEEREPREIGVGLLARVEAGGFLERVETLANRLRLIRSEGIGCFESLEFRMNLTPLQRVRINLI